MYDVLCKEKPGKHLFSSRNILFTSKQRCAIANQSFFLSRTLCVLQTYVAFKYLSSLESLTLLKLRFLKPFRPEKEVVEIIKKRLLPGWPPVFLRIKCWGTRKCHICQKYFFLSFVRHYVLCHYKLKCY